MLTLIRNRLWTPERIALSPKKVKGGWVFEHPPRDLWRYNRHARNQAIREWALYGAGALASIVGGYPAMFGTLTTDGSDFFPMPEWGNGTIGTSTTVLDAAGEYVGQVCQAPKTGSIRGIGFLASGAVGTPTADIKLETVDAATGYPTGTLFGANTSRTGVAVTAAWNDTGDFTADASVTRGDILAAVVRYASGTSITLPYPSSNFRSGFPYQVLNTGTPAKSLLGSFALRYSDGTYGPIMGVWPMSSTTLEENFSSSTNPNHRGNVYTPTTPRRCIGGWVRHWSTSASDLIIATDAWDGTADNDGTSNLTMAVDPDFAGFTVQAVKFFLSSGSLAFAAGTKYRSLVKPTTTSNNNIQVLTVNAAAILDQMPGGQIVHYTAANSPTGAGDWTQTTTKRAFCGFWFDQFDDGASVGGTTIAGTPMRRGMV